CATVPSRDPRHNPYMSDVAHRPGPSRVLRSGLGSRGQAEIQRRAFIGAAIRPHPATVTGDDPMHDRQTDAGARERLLRMEALKHAEELVGIAHVETDAVVAHVVDGVRALAQCALFDAGWIAAGAEFEGIGQQVDQHLRSEEHTSELQSLAYLVCRLLLE